MAKMRRDKSADLEQAYPHEKITSVVCSGLAAATLERSPQDALKLQS